MRAAVSPGPRALAVPAIAGLLFVVVPVMALLGHVSWRELPGELSSAAVRTAVLLSLECSLLALLLSLLLGVPLAMLLAHGRVPARRLVRAAVVLPLLLPPVVGGIALQAALGRTAPIGRALHGVFGIVLPFSTAGAVLAETFVAFPLLVLTVEAGLRQRDLRHEELAATLGARPWRRFWLVTMPLLMPSITAGAALCWARALGEFGATITFAGSYPGTTQTLPLAAYAAFEGSGAVTRTVTLSVILLLISIALLLGLRQRGLAATG